MFQRINDEGLRDRFTGIRPGGQVGRDSASASSLLQKHIYYSFFVIRD